MTEQRKREDRGPEPWLRGTLTHTPAVIRGVLDALELAREDAERWCADMTGMEANLQPFGLPSLAFQMRHIAGSLDRLLTYAEDRELTAAQLANLSRESESGLPAHLLLREFDRAIDGASMRVCALAGADFEQVRFVGRKRLPTTLGGLLVHVADHTQRHAGQLVTTAKVVKAGRKV